MLKVCVTGHRPKKLGYDENSPTRVWVKDSLAEVVDTIRPNYAYIGMALGTDQDFARICIDKGIPFTAVLPFPEQAEKWPPAAQFVYWRLMQKARDKEVVCESGYAAWKIQRRNEWMVDAIEDNGIVIAVWDGSQSGTAGCVNYARHMDRRVIRLNPATREIIY